MEEKDEERIVRKEWNTDGKREWKKEQLMKRYTDMRGQQRARKQGHEINGTSKMRRRY